MVQQHFIIKSKIIFQHTLFVVGEVVVVVSQESPLDWVCLGLGHSNRGGVGHRGHGGCWEHQGWHVNTVTHRLDLFRPWASLTGVRMSPDGGGRMGSNYPDQLSLLRRHFTGQLPSVRLLARDQVWSVTSSDYLSWRGIDQPSFTAFCWRSVECWCEQAVCWPHRVHLC